MFHPLASIAASGVDARPPAMSDKWEVSDIHFIPSSWECRSISACRAAPVDDPVISGLARIRTGGVQPELRGVVLARGDGFQISGLSEGNTAYLPSGDPQTVGSFWSPLREA
jgi:hypothetical protein